MLRHVPSLTLAVLVLAGINAFPQQPAPNTPGTYGNWLPGSTGKDGKKSEDANTRAVTGSVKNADDSASEGAVVQLKNTKSMQIRSFITKPDGIYTFQGLSTNVDYELKAEGNGFTSPVRTLSSFDDRKRAIIHLKLETKKP